MKNLAIQIRLKNLLLKVMPSKQRFGIILPIIAVILSVLIACKMKSGETEKSVNKYELKQVWATDTLFRTPEGVLYDSVNQVVYVSNVNMNPWGLDSNGFISKMNIKGEILDLEWVTGLNSPKGMGIKDNILYVTDIVSVVEIDIATGNILHSIPAAEGDQLNDITVSANGEIYVSASGGGKVYKIENDILVEFLSIPDSRPNGVFASKDSIMLLTSATHRAFSVAYGTAEITELAQNLGHADGIVPVGDGSYIASDWSGGIFHVKTDLTVDTLNYFAEERFNTADIEYIISENLLLVPTFFNNRVVAYNLVEKQ